MLAHTNRTTTRVPDISSTNVPQITTTNVSNITTTTVPLFGFFFEHSMYLASCHLYSISIWFVNRSNPFGIRSRISWHFNRSINNKCINDRFIQQTISRTNRASIPFHKLITGANTTSWQVHPCLTLLGYLSDTHPTPEWHMSDTYLTPIWYLSDTYLTHNCLTHDATDTQHSPVYKVSIVKVLLIV